jgi:hypothetical protein
MKNPAERPDIQSVVEEFQEFCKKEASDEVGSSPDTTPSHPNSQRELDGAKLTLTPDVDQ